MKVLTQNITVGAYTFEASNNIEIQLSTRNLVNTCKITIPTSSVIQNENGDKLFQDSQKAFKRGDKVSVNIGYNGENFNEFEGYVKQINTGTPTVLECEDSAYLLRNNYITESYLSVSLKTLLLKVVEGVGIPLSPNIPDLTITKVSLSDTSGLDVLRELKKTYGLVSFINKDNQLYCGLAYTETGQTINLQTNLNVISTDSLSFNDRSEENVQVKVTIFNENGTQETKTFGKSGGATRTLFLYDIESGFDVESWANSEIEKYKAQTLEGSIETFIQPRIQPTDIININDVDYPERNGNYYIEEVVINFGMNGGRRTITIGQKV